MTRALFGEPDQVVVLIGGAGEGPRGVGSEENNLVRIGSLDKRAHQYVESLAGDNQLIGTITPLVQLPDDPSSHIYRTV